MEGVLLFAPLSLQGLRTGQPKIALGSPRGAHWSSHAGETLVFLKSERFAYTRAPSSISGNAVFAPGQPPERKKKTRRENNEKTLLERPGVPQASLRRPVWHTFRARTVPCWSTLEIVSADLKQNPTSPLGVRWFRVSLNHYPL